MSAFKKLYNQDVYITSYTAKKTWNVSSASLEEFNIQVLAGISGSTLDYIPQASDIYSGSKIDSGSYKPLVYRQLNQLYYQPFNSSSGEIPVSSSYEYYNQSSFLSGSRYLDQNVTVYSLPRNIVGTHIEPGTVVITDNNGFVASQDTYVEPEYFTGNYRLEDDGEGNLLKSTTSANKGNIIYPHGLVIVTDNTLAEFYEDNPNSNLTWKSNQPIYTYNFNLKIADSEFNYTLNPTAQISGSNGQLRNSLTGSEFRPYITSVGLYNDANELIAVAKLSKPIPKSNNSDTSIQIKLDI